MAESPDIWTRWWTPEQLDELITAASRLEPSDLAHLDAAAAPESIRALAIDIRADLIDRHGFTLLRGFPVDELGRNTIAAAFMLLGCVIGRPRSQNAAGHLLGHVKDVGADLTDSSTRIYQTNERQSFHTDSTDAVALLCLHTARSGGLSQLASAETVYRIVRERRPDLAARLFDSIATDRRGEQPEGQLPWFEIPVLSWHDGQLTVLYQRTYIRSAARFGEAPQPTPEQVEALDLFDDVVNEPDVHLVMAFEPGDMQFAYNHSLLHDRTGFVDDPDLAARRHLLRLWLSLPGDRNLPPVFAQRYGSIEVGDRGGIVVADTELCVPLDV
ncbi:MAG: TauD/TfdA family dioxygenase [Acidimicrobiia bacterium]|nr:TauD/TfdA family dioxygenase [Acidimicrobiia bacterium]